MAEIVAAHADYFPLRRLASDEQRPRGAARDDARSRSSARRASRFHQLNAALDEPEFYPIFERMANSRLPVWCIRRHREIRRLRQREQIKYEIYWLFGWPTRRAFSWRGLVLGNDGEAPGLKIITHHLADAPFFDGGCYGMDQLGTRTSTRTTPSS